MINLPFRRFASRAAPKAPKVPAILSDIDGVIKLGPNPIPGSSEVVQRLLKPFSIEGKPVKLPFSLLTNSGGSPESDRACKINDIIYTPSQKEVSPLVDASTTILCHTPFSEDGLLEKYRDEFVVVSGCGDIVEIAQKEYGYQRVIDIEEVLAIFPQSVPNLDREEHYSKEQQSALQQQLLARFADVTMKTETRPYASIKDIKKELKVAAFFLYSDAVNLELNIQILCDLITSKDGYIADPQGGSNRRKKGDPQVVDIYVSNPDFEYADTFQWNRHGQGIILHSLEAVFRASHPHLYPYDLQLFGKPTVPTFDFAKARLEEQAKAQGVEISNFYMIGDNPLADIKGGNDNDCVSVLVKTGVWEAEHGQSNDAENPAVKVCSDMAAAWEWIQEREGLM